MAELHIQRLLNAATCGSV